MTASDEVTIERALRWLSASGVDCLSPEKAAHQGQMRTLIHFTLALR